MFEPLTEGILNLVKALIALFIIVDPFGNIPIFISLTKDMDKKAREKVFHTATFTGLILLLAFALLGKQILAFFGITIHSFMIAGGILLLIIAIRLLVEDEWATPTRSREDVGAVPIAMPLLVGPGAITTTMLILQEFDIIITVASVVIVFALVWLVLRLIDPIYRFLGKSGASIIAKIMALLIAAIAIQYIISGVSHYFPSAEG